MMRCAEIHELLPLWPYGELPPEQTAVVEKHLADCPACRREAQALQDARQQLDVVPAPAVQVDLSRLYAVAARSQRRRLRRWQYSAAALAVAASVLFVALALKVEVRAEARQVTVRWGPPAVEVARPVAPPAPAEHPEELQLLKDLVRALADEVELRDERRREELTVLQRRLDVLQRQNQQVWAAAEREVAALVAVQLKNSEKGAQ